MLKLTGVTKTFFPGTVNERRALNLDHLELAAGEFVTVIGSNGAGKSTLLNMVSGKLTPDTGTVEIDGKDVTKLPDHRRAGLIGRVFQDPMASTAPDLTIEQNLSIALTRGQRRGLGPGVTNARRARFREELTQLEQGLENRLSAKVGLLSGGQRQALSLLMATFSEPRVLLLDEHTAALDPSRADLVVRLTKSLVELHTPTTLMVTHNMDQALGLGDRLIMMHEGRVVVDIAGEKKKNATVKDLLAAFEDVKGAELSDRSLLG
ncbi:MAG: ABC transporter ATP-binding protein [Mobilicoccus sp.]|nr:ABC transporter ATP-binding protein [Mobilicoccus sp.]